MSAAKRAPKRRPQTKPALRTVELRPEEAAEIRLLRVLLLQAQANAQCIIEHAQKIAQQTVQTTDTLLKARAMEVARGYGIDLSPEAPGRWHLDPDRGEIRQLPET